MSATTITVRVPLTIRKRGGPKVLISPNGATIPGVPRQATTSADPALLKVLARAFRWKRMLDEGRYSSVSDIARAEKIDRSYAGRILTLTLLAPDIVEAIMDGRQPAELGVHGCGRGFRWSGGSNADPLGCPPNRRRLSPPGSIGHLGTEAGRHRQSSGRSPAHSAPMPK
jgi:hypothetical protein